MRAYLIVIAMGLAGCGGPSAKGIGEECVGSAECADGLVCDVNVTPHVCADNLTPLPPDAEVVDAPPPPPDSPPGTPDASPPDAPLPDAPLPDAAPPDAAPDAML
jgi:hypothetical protein